MGEHKGRNRRHFYEVLHVLDLSHVFTAVVFLVIGYLICLLQWIMTVVGHDDGLRDIDE